MKGQATKKIFVVAAIILGTGVNGLYGADWTGFRGAGIRGDSQETGLAITWSESENLKWKTALPGPGSSSPIIVGEGFWVRRLML